MDAEVSALIGAAHGERAPERRPTRRNGYRERRWDTRVGSLDLSIPSLREGSYFPSLLEPRRRAERALLGGCSGGLCRWRLDAPGRGARGRPWHRRDERERGQPYLRRPRRGGRRLPLPPARSVRLPVPVLHALYHKVREDGRVVNMATLIAVGVSTNGERSVMGVEVAGAGGDMGALQHILGLDPLGYRRVGSER